MDIDNNLYGIATDPIDSQVNAEVNETCFFKNDTKAFENTKSHDALFQSSLGGGILADL